VPSAGSPSSVGSKTRNGPNGVAAAHTASPDYAVDRRRVLVTGFSMGGFGTWQTIVDFPERFAAIAPVCGGGNPYQARRLKNVPTWIFHGAKDPAVPVQASMQMNESLKQVGADVKLTVYPDLGHDCWTVTYDNQELYDWFLSHKRGGKTQTPQK